MVVLNSIESHEIRQKYIEAFINTSSAHFIKYIDHLESFSDGLCYSGYLWDCLKKPTIVMEEDCLQILKGKKHFYVMWDIHSADRIFVPNYWKYPKESILLLEEWIDKNIKDLPEDLYFFDSSFSWSVILTHETMVGTQRYCLTAESVSRGRFS